MIIPFTEEVGNVDLMIGYHYFLKPLFIQIGSGVSYLKGTKRGTYHSGGGLFSSERYDKLEFNDIGLPIDLNISYSLREKFYLGVGYYININIQYPYNGFYVSVRVLKF